MRVLFVSHVSEKYGAGRSLLDLIDGLLVKGVKCFVIIPKKGLLIQELEARDIKYSILQIKSWTFSDRASLKHMCCSGLNIFSSLVIALKALFWKVDLIHTNSSVIPSGALAAFIARKPHVWHIREFGVEHYGLSFDLGEALSFKLMNKLSFAIIVISKALLQKYSKHFPREKLYKIYDAVSVLSQICSKKKSEVITLAVIGWIYPGKGQIDAVLAVVQLIKLGIQVKLKIIGDGEEKYIKHLKKIIVQNNISKYIEFTGYVDNMALIYNTVDIILICSKWEAFGRVAVEGMLFKKSVIGARSGATPELIKNGFNGLLYKPGDYKELAEKIKYLINNPEKAKQMRENGFQQASKKYAVEKYADQVYNIFQQAIKNK